MTMGCTLPSRGTAATPDNLRTLATRAEALGFDHIWISDHIVLPTSVQSKYPYDPDGVAPFTANPSMAYWDPLATLAFLAACTNRVKLGTHVLVLPYRDPVVTAKTIATIDCISSGRVILGVGVGWMEEEFQALGLDTYADRGAVSDEYIAIFKELWTKDDPEFSGRYTQFSGIKFYPKPVQKPHVPIWVGGHTRAAMRRAANLGDGWLPIGLRPPASLEPEEMAGDIARLARMTERAGRRPEDVDIVFSSNIRFDGPSGAARRTLSGHPDQIARDIQRYKDAGVAHFIFGFEGSTMDQLLEQMERLGKEVLPQAR